MKTTLSILAAGVALAALPALAHAQAHPDFTGVWQVSPYSASLKPADGKPVPFTAQGKAAYDKVQAASAKGDMSWDGARECLPEGLPRLMIINKPFEILQRDKAVYFVAQNRLPWRAYFNEKPPADADPLWLGYETAHWDGNTLVVESTGFRDGTVLDDKGLPHTEQLHLTQRFTLGKDGKTMTVATTIQDPGAYTRPWTARSTFAKKPASFEMPEEVCAERLASTAPKK